MPRYKTATGFTLIEMSVVLVVIALITGGILVGRDLVQASQLRKVISDVTNIKSAIAAYRERFRALPGDDPRAQSWFGAAACPDEDVGTGQVCNGNGDGYIQSGVNLMETYKAWEHLSLAKLVPGTYTGVYGDNPANLWIPSGIYGGAVYRATNEPTVYNRNGSYIQLGSTNTFFTAGGVLNTPDAYSIDAKMDDGKADHGDVYTYNSQDGPSNTCTTLDYNQPNGSYIMTNQKIRCIMVFWIK